MKIEEEIKTLTDRVNDIDNSLDRVGVPQTKDGAYSSLHDMVRDHSDVIQRLEKHFENTDQNKPLVNASGFGAVAMALAKAQGEFPEIPKTKTATVHGKDGKPGYSYNYADLADIQRATAPALSKHELAITQLIEQMGGGAKHWLVTRLIHSSGQMLVSSLDLPTIQGRPQELGSILTYYRRYQICGLLGIAADEDEDGNIASGKDAKIKNKGAAVKPSGEPSPVKPKPAPETKPEPAPKPDFKKYEDENKAKAQVAAEEKAKEHPGRISTVELKALVMATTKAGWKPAQVTEVLGLAYDLKTASDLTRQQCNDLYKLLEMKPEEAQAFAIKRRSDAAKSDQAAVEAT